MAMGLQNLKVMSVSSCPQNDDQMAMGLQDLKYMSVLSCVTDKEGHSKR